MGVVAAALCVAVQSSPAAAFECLTTSCPRWCDAPVEYSISVISEDIDEAVSVPDIQRGMDDWSSVSCTNLTTNYLGRTGADARESDGNAVIGWIENRWPHGSSAIGVASPRWTNSGTGGACIVEADIVMNGENYSWTTAPGKAGNVNHPHSDVLKRFA